MEIFIGSSREHLSVVRLVESWLEAEGHRPVAWDQPGLFAAGDYTFDGLTRICQRVDAAVLIFGEDDRTWYRGDDGMQPRDNVLIEFGLFAGVFGRRKAIVCQVGKPRVAADLLGLTFIDTGKTAAKRGRAEIVRWARTLQSNDGFDLLLELSDERRFKVVGRWKGTFEQPEYVGGPLSLTVDIEFGSRNGPLKGTARVRGRLLEHHQGGPRDLDVHLVLSGGVRHSHFLKLEYRSDDPGIIQFGSIMLALSAEGTRLSGRFVGYGSISEQIISGTVILRKLARNRPNSYQPSPDQERRSSPPGRARKSKRSRRK